MLATSFHNLTNSSVMGSDQATQRPPAKRKLFARPVGRIRDQDTSEYVGWVYEWNNGERGTTWNSGKRENVVIEQYSEGHAVS